ncbi:MAG: polysaccharide biosynthesis/export family protein [Marinibacterium sp.]|nr:polysaccharide biosynthesis/export family protein [Marinibacterium sp.]
MLVSPTFAQPLDPYRFGLDERLALKVLTWSEDGRRYEIWPAVSGEYRVQSDGTILVPLAGTIKAAGLTAPELSDRVAAALQTTLGALEPPAATVEVVEYRPFYIVGDVGRPGAYPANPGLTVAQAVAISGGADLLASDTVGARTVLNDTETLRSLMIDLLRARMRKARLQAELDGLDDRSDIAFPDSLTHPEGHPALQALIAEELAIFDSRLAAYQLKAETLSDLQTLLRSEIENLQARMRGQSEQTRLARETLENISSLAERGLTRNTNLVEAQRRLIELEGRELNLQNDLYQAQQKATEAERDMVELETQRRTQAATEMQQTNANLERISSRQALFQQLLSDANAEIDSTLIPQVTTRYTILAEGTTEAVDADAATRLSPGDILTVTRQLGP